MPLVKVQHGLLEEENFYLSSPVTDFLGSGAWSRTEEVFRLRSGTVLRRLPYDAFVVDVRKEAVSLSGSDRFEFFIEDSNGRLGLREEAGDEPVTGWRIIYHEGFMQVYASTGDGGAWENKGGARVDLEGEIRQGFSLRGNEELVITDYRVYSNPNLTLQNFSPGTLARLTGPDENVLERYFNEDYECAFFLGGCDYRISRNS